MSRKECKGWCRFIVYVCVIGLGLVALATLGLMFV